MVEYLILAAALAITLFGVGSPVGRMVTDAMRAFYANVTLFLSLP
jgi:hypothetical protein